MNPETTPPMTSQEWFYLGVGLAVMILGMSVVKSILGYRQGYRDLPVWMRFVAVYGLRQAVPWPNAARLELMAHNRQRHQEEVAAAKKRKERAAKKQERVASLAQLEAQAQPPKQRVERVVSAATSLARSADHPRFRPALAVAPMGLATEPALVLPEPDAPMVLPSPSAEVEPVIAQPEWIAGTHQKVVHLLVVGETDAGKTSTVLPILDQRLRAGELFVILDPHAIKNNWGPLKPYVVGWGRNFGEINTWLLAIAGEMNRRFKLDEGDPAIGPNVTIVIDEALAVKGNCPAWGEIIKTFTSEARKVHMRLIILTQSDRVESLGLEGQGDLRRNLSFLRLGDKVGVKKREGDIWPASLECPKLYGGNETLIDRTNLHQRQVQHLEAQHLWFPKELPVGPPIQSTGATRPWPARSLENIRAGITIDYDEVAVEELLGEDAVVQTLHELMTIYPNQPHDWYLEHLAKQHDIGGTKPARKKAYTQLVRQREHALTNSLNALEVA